jgi:hypothetical protein
VSARRLAAGLVCALLASPAAAQEWFLEAEAGGLAFTAKDSVKAVFGQEGAPIFGLGGGYQTSFGVFFRAGVRRVSQDGERVFVAGPGSPVFGLGHPLSATITPVFGTVGYRFGTGTFRPYYGLGAGITSYREESTIGGVTESLDVSRFSWRVVGGVQVLRGPLRFSIEASFSSAPDLLGRGGVSAVYGETKGGGVSAVAKVIFVP